MHSLVSNTEVRSGRAYVLFMPEKKEVSGVKDRLVKLSTRGVTLWRLGEKNQFIIIIIN